MVEVPEVGSSNEQGIMAGRKRNGGSVTRNRDMGGARFSDWDAAHSNGPW